MSNILQVFPKVTSLVSLRDAPWAFQDISVMTDEVLHLGTPRLWDFRMRSGTNLMEDSVGPSLWCPCRKEAISHCGVSRNQHVGVEDERTVASFTVLALGD